MSRPSHTEIDPVRAANDPMLGRIIADRYRIIEEIGSGGMGRVYKALQVPFDRVVALKLLAARDDRDEAFAKRFFLEASVTAHLSHPNTISVHDYGCTDDRVFFIVMEHLKGRTLSEVLQREGPLPQDRAIHIVQQVCRSLAEAHGMGVIHRDIKPANIMLLAERDDHDFVKVLDFGLVKVLAEGDQHRITSRGSFVGSPHYMAPEQARNLSADQRSDIYSVGVVLYHMLAGVPPFDAPSTVDVILKHVLEPPRALKEVRPDREVAPELEAIIHKCLAKEPLQRYQSMDELLSDLKAVRGRGPRTDSMPPYAVSAGSLPPTPYPDSRTPSGPMSMPAPPAEAAQSPASATLSDEWLRAFSEVHERAKVGALNAADMAGYQRDRETLSNALLAAQTLSTRSGGRVRKSLRLIRALSIQIRGAAQINSKTLDLDAGGFAVLQTAPMRAGDRVEFEIELAQGRLAGKARVVNVQRKGRGFRIGFAFETLSPVDVTRIQLEIVDAVLARVRR